MGIDVKIPDIRVSSFTNLDFNLLLKLVGNIDLSPNYRLSSIKGMKIDITRAKKSKQRDKKESGLLKKIKKKKSKQDKDIVVIIDESEKHKDELDEQMEAITMDMDGFEKIHLQQYEKQLEQYKRFLSEYLKEAEYATKAYDAYQEKEDKGKRKFEWGQEVVTFREIKDIARRIHMNALLSGNSTGDMSGHNSISWSEGQEYKFWKYASKFNEMMSFVIYDTIGGGG
jgi:hypothetical protein